MERRLLVSVMIVLVSASATLLVFAIGTGVFTTASNPCSLRVLQTIGIPNTAGRIDHMDLDPISQVLFVAALENNSLAEVSLRQAKLVGSVTSLSEPQGVLVLHDLGEVFVTNGGTGDVAVFNAQSLKLLDKISLGSDADNVRYDPGTRLVYVGFGTGGIGIINVDTHQVVQRVELAWHPESFQIGDGSKRLYVNVPTGNYIAVVYLSTHSIVARWPITNATGNFPMAVDSLNNRLFVATRSPSDLAVIDTHSGNIVARVGVPEDPDDIYLASGCIYVLSGGGYLTAIRQIDPNDYATAQEIPTSPGARTSLYAASSGLLFVAAPSSSGEESRIIVLGAAKGP